MKANIFSVLQVEPFRWTTNQQPESESINQATDEKTIKEIDVKEQNEYKTVAI